MNILYNKNLEDIESFYWLRNKKKFHEKSISINFSINLLIN